MHSIVRVFVAIPISQKLQNIIRLWQENFNHFPVRWLAGKNIHVTLVPPMHVETEELNEICKKIESIKNSTSPYNVTFNNITYGPNPKNPRLIWANGDASPKTEKLKRILEKSLNKKNENRKFLPHLTLARFRPEMFSKLPIKNLNEKINWQETVREIVIMKSHHTPIGADYEIIHRVSL